MTSQDHPDGPDADLERRAAQMFVDVLADTHLSGPSDLAPLLDLHARTIGAQDLVLYLVDYGQSLLVPVPAAHVTETEALRIEGSVAGRAFAFTEMYDVDADEPGMRRLWAPLLDGTERLGVLRVTVPAPTGTIGPTLLTVCERYAHLAAQLVVGKSQYGDLFETVRRREPMGVSAELQWKLLPPSLFATSGFVVAGMLEPAYHAGGDTFDYAVNGGTAHLAVLDAMGHGLSVAVTASIALSAYRNGRRRRLDLPGTYTETDEAVGREFRGERYATGVLARLDLESGVLTWINAGHPAPLLLRRGHLVKELDSPASTPLGVQLDRDPPVVGREALEPGDRLLLYTDGLVEARNSEGEFFTPERLAEFLEREAAAGLPAPETLRRMRHAVLDYQKGKLQDDATALLVEWRGGTERTLVPQTV
jgi:hypothetical protein